MKFSLKRDPPRACPAVGAIAIISEGLNDFNLAQSSSIGFVKTTSESAYIAALAFPLNYILIMLLVSFTIYRFAKKHRSQETK